MDSAPGGLVISVRYSHTICVSDQIMKDKYMLKNDNGGSLTGP